MLGKRDQALLGEQLLRLYRAADVETFPGRVLDAMRPLIGTEISCVTQIAPASGWARNDSDRPDDDVAALLPVLAEYQHQHPRLTAYARNGIESAATISDYLEKSTWESTDLFNLFYRPLGLGAQICIVFPATEEIAMAIVANRAERSFTDRDRHVLDAMLPHVKSAYENARAFDQLRSDGEAVAEVGRCTHVQISADGRVQYTPRLARELLGEFLPNAEQPTDRLRGALEKWVSAQLRARDPESIHRAHEVRGPSGRLRLRLIRSATGDGWLLALQHVPDVAISESDARVASLPPRSRQVLERLLLGDSEKEVAARLEISRHTVHDHVKRIHRTFDVASRGELLSLFMRG